LAAIVKLTVPLPLPLAPAVIVSHEALLVAVHAQPAGAVTATGVPAPPAAPAVWLLDAIENAQLPACDTVNVCPAMESVPLRAAPVLAAIVKLTVPLPLPLVPAVIVSHVALLVAVHAQPEGADTATGVPAPPAAPAVWVLDAIENAQPPACDTVNVCPAMESVPLRAAPVLAAIVKLTVPLPLPLVPVVMASHESLLLAVQAHPAAADTVTGVPAPPEVAIDCVLGEIEYAHAPPCDTVNV
jgi:hypothetical protein